MKKKLFDRIDVKGPCNESWEEMTGNDKVRFCSHCSKNVHNLSSMTRAIAEKLVRDSNGQLCVRYSKDASGKVVTAPPRLTQIGRQATVAASVLATSLALSTLSYSQGKPVPVNADRESDPEVGSQKRRDSFDQFIVSGVVQDIQGAVVPGARVTLRKAKTDVLRFVATSDVGRFEFRKVEAGDYDIEVVSPGFKKFILQNVSISASVQFETELILDPSGEVVGLLTIVDGQPIETPEPQVETPVQGRPLIDLPLNSRTTTLGLIYIAPEPPKTSKKKNKKLPK